MLSLPPANEVSGKVIFSEACVKNSVYRAGVHARVGLGPGGGGDGWQDDACPGGMHARGSVHACLGGIHGWRACMAGWQRGACMGKGGHAWQKGGMHGEGACVVRGA